MDMRFFWWLAGWSYIALVALSACGGSTHEDNSLSHGRLKVVCLGDGLTAGTGVPADSAYPAQLERLLNAKGYQAKVVNAGIKGEVVADAAARVAWLLQQRFDIFVLATGWDDLRQRPEAGEDRAQAMGALVKTITTAAPESPLWLMLPPAHATFTAPQATFAKDVTALAAEYPGCQVLPPLSRAANAGTYWQDDLPYPNTAGQRQLAEQIFEMINTTYE